MNDSNSIRPWPSIRYFVRHAWRYKALFIGIFIAVPIASVTLFYLPPLIVADILQRISDGNFAHGQLWESFGPSLVLYAAFLVVGGIFMWRIANLLIWTLETRVLRDIHREVFAHLLNLSANFHSNSFSGSLVSQANKLAGAYVRFADTAVYDLTTLLLSFIVTFTILLPRTPWIALALLVLSLLFIGLAVKITKSVRILRGREATAETKQTGFLADAITNVMAIKSFAGSRHENGRYAEATDRSKRATNKVMWASAKRDFAFASSTITIGTTSLVMAVAAMVLFNADIATAFLVIVYTGIITERLWEFAERTLRELNRSFGDAQAMIDILAEQPEITDPKRPEPVRINAGAISFTDVTFNHPESNEADGLFKDLNLAVRAGEKIGLVGHSGSGKTTLTRLLLRFNDIDSGAITIDGQNITAIAQDDLRRAIAYVPQEPLLFHRSIRENIAYGNPDATEKEIELAAQKAYADEFIQKLPKGYETLVGERGVKLSGGQRQRIVIARAILKDAPILVLDEATSALDSESEKLIQAALWELMAKRTAIVIAHRLSTIQKMDRIVVLEKGKIVEQGTHQQLLKAKGVYASLWEHQSGGFIEG